MNGKRTRIGMALAIGLAAATACADGVFVWRRGVDLVEPSQIGVILHDEGLEDLVLQVKYKGEAKDFAWVVPLPAPPKVQAVQSGLFEEISEYTQRRQRWYAWSGFTPRGLEKTEVDVLERKKVSVYDVSVLQAKDSAALMNWLGKNGYSLPQRAAKLIGEYVKKGWTFTAIRIHPDDRKLWTEKLGGGGTLAPLKFTFPSKKIVYPLKISSLNRGQTEVLLYVFAADAVVHPALEAQAPRAVEFYYLPRKPKDQWEQASRKRFPASFDLDRKFYRAVRPDELPVCRQVLPRLAKRPYFLSKLRRTFKTAEMTEDLVLCPPEQLSPQRRLEFVRRHTRRPEDESKHRYDLFDNALLLRASQETVAVIAETLKRPPDKRLWTYEGEMRFLLHDHSRPGEKLLDDALKHEDVKVRRSIAEVIDYYGAGIDRFLPVLKKLSIQSDPAVVGRVCEACGEIKSDEAMAILVEILDRALRQPRTDRRSPDHPRRSALQNLWMFNDAKLIPVYLRAYKKAKLSQDETLFCLKGLQAIDDPAALPAAEEILANSYHNRREERVVESMRAKWKR